MSRGVLALFVCLAAALAAFGLLADRALVREATASAELSLARGEQDARTAALSVRGALGQIEQALLAGRPWSGVRQQTLVLPPESSTSDRSYRGRSPSELVALLLSTEVTGWGLPEAVVAAVALGSPKTRSDVRERLLAGQLPVRAEDLAELAAVLGAENDPRVPDLERRLREAPDLHDLPQAPAFRRAVRQDGAAVEGWTRRGRTALRYEIGVEALFAAAGVAERASIATPSPSPSAGWARAAVPDIPSLMLALRPEAAPRGRLLAARGLLWLAVAAGLGALLLVHRALAREARAISREKMFVAGVTHELRTPVAAIRVFGEALAEGLGDSREYGALLAEESERLEALVERVLAATRMDVAPRFEKVQPAELLISAVRLMRPRAERRGVALTIGSAGDLGEARWDADAVRRALLSLIDNAIKHGRANGHVEVRAEAEGPCLRLSVRDDGPGIARRDHRRLFGRFERGATETAGAGLGLYLVDQVARAHAGRADLEQEGRGCVFTLLLPRVPPGILEAGRSDPERPAEAPDS